MKGGKKTDSKKALVPAPLEKELPVEKGSRTILEQVGVGIFQAGIIAMTSSPIVGLLAGGSVKGAIDYLKETAEERAKERAEAYAAAFQEALKDAVKDKVFDDDEIALEEFGNDPHFKESIFQTYRKAMDALCPAVVPAIARLGVFFAQKPFDSLFRGLGRTLQDIEDEAMLESLQRMLSAAVEASGGVGERVEVEVTPTEDGSHQVLLTVDDGRMIQDDNGDLSWCRGRYGYRAHPADFIFLEAVLRLAERNGLVHGDWGRTRENAPAASFIFEALLCERALLIVGRVEIKLFRVETAPIAVKSSG